MRRGPWIARGLLLCLLAAILAACGGDEKADPTATVTVQALSEPTTSPTLAPGEVTAGQIADRISAAWGNVKSYRAITVILPASGTPVSSPEVELSGSAERHVILPDQKQILITDQGATTEIVLVNGVLSKRTIPQTGTPGPWETVDPAKVATNDPFARTYETILAAEAAPYSGLATRQRDRIGAEQGGARISDRDCTGYLFPEVTETGERIQVIVYLDADDLPCRIETRAGLSISQTDYVFNEEAGFATPVAVASPASP